MPVDTTAVFLNWGGENCCGIEKMTLKLNCTFLQVAAELQLCFWGVIVSSGGGVYSQADYQCSSLTAQVGCLMDAVIVELPNCFAEPEAPTL